MLHLLPGHADDLLLALCASGGASYLYRKIRLSFMAGLQWGKHAIFVMRTRFKPHRLTTNRLAGSAKAEAGR